VLGKCHTIVCRDDTAVCTVEQLDGEVRFKFLNCFGDGWLRPRNSAAPLRLEKSSIATITRSWRNFSRDKIFSDKSTITPVTRLMILLYLIRTGIINRRPECHIGG
jgi:hypothetical protein